MRGGGEDSNVLLYLSVMRPDAEYFPALMRRLLDHWDPYSGHCRVDSVEIRAGENPIPAEYQPAAMATLPPRDPFTGQLPMSIDPHDPDAAAAQLAAAPPQSTVDARAECLLLSRHLSIMLERAAHGEEPTAEEQKEASELLDRLNYRRGFRTRELTQALPVEPPQTHYPHGLDDPQPYPPAD